MMLNIHSKCPGWAALLALTACSGGTDDADTTPSSTSDVSVGSASTATSDFDADASDYVAPEPCIAESVEDTPIASSSLLVGEMPGTRPRQLKTDDTHVYWVRGEAEQAYVERVAKSGGAVETLAMIDDGEFYVTLALGGDYAYIRSRDGDFRVPKAGGEPETLEASWDTVLYIKQPMASDGEVMYVLDGYCFFSDDGAVFAISNTDGAITELESGLPCADEVVVDDEYLYLYVPGEDAKPILGIYVDAQVFRMPKLGGDLELLASVPNGLHSLRVSGDYLYGVINEETLEEPEPGLNLDDSVVRIPTSGGPAERVGDTRCVDTDTSILGIDDEEIEAADGYYYYKDSSGFLRWNSDGTNPVRFVPAESESNYEMELSDGSVYQISSNGIWAHSLE